MLPDWLVLLLTVQHLQLHIITFETQRGSFMDTRTKLLAGELHLTADFGTHAVQFGATGKLPDLVFVFEFLDSNGDHVHAYIDCVFWTSTRARTGTMCRL